MKEVLKMVINGNSYRFKAWNDSKYLNVYTSGMLYNNQNVCTYEIVNSDMAQVWDLTNYSGYGVSGQLLRSRKDDKYVLDHWRGSSNTHNADIYKVGTNQTDLKDQLLEIIQLSNGCYRIKLKYPTSTGSFLYLTVNSSITPHNVQWAPMTGNTDQLWYREDYKNQLTYPCHNMRITQRHDGTTSHIGGSNGTPCDYAIDEGCENSGRSYMYCPCDEMEIIRLYGIGNNGTNTIWLKSTSPVTTPIGTDYMVMMVIHPLDDDLSSLHVGQKFYRGEPMFREGNDGNASGYHFHISMGFGNISGNGWAKNSNGVWVLTTTGGNIKINEAFFVDPYFTNIINSNGYSFVTL
jgi:hypothetical protein